MIYICLYKILCLSLYHVKKIVVQSKIIVMVIQFNNQIIDKSIFKNFSHSSNIIKLSNGEYKRLKLGVIRTNDEDDKECTIEYKQNYEDYFDTITFTVFI